MKTSTALVAGLLALLAATPADSGQATTLPATVELLTRRARDGTTYIYEVPQERLDAIPQWDPARVR